MWQNKLLGDYMTVMRMLYIILAVLVVAALISLSRCRATSHLKEDKNIDDNFIASMQQMDRLAWLEARNKIDDEDDELRSSDIRYIKDIRTDLCFAIYKNFGFQKVPCGHLQDVL